MLFRSATESPPRSSLSSPRRSLASPSSQATTTTSSTLSDRTTFIACCRFVPLAKPARARADPKRRAGKRAQSRRERWPRSPHADRSRVQRLHHARSLLPRQVARSFLFRSFLFRLLTSCKAVVTRQINKEARRTRRTTSPSRPCPSQSPSCSCPVRSSRAP